jgi:hypothetical protein
VVIGLSLELAHAPGVIRFHVAASAAVLPDPSEPETPPPRPSGR